MEGGTTPDAVHAWTRAQLLQQFALAQISLFSSAHHGVQQWNSCALKIYNRSIKSTITNPQSDSEQHDFDLFTPDHECAQLCRMRPRMPELLVTESAGGDE